jgi:hypothetical protein
MSPQTPNPLQTAWEDLTQKQAVAVAHKAAADHAVAQATDSAKTLALALETHINALRKAFGV